MFYLIFLLNLENYFRWDFFLCFKILSEILGLVCVVVNIIMMFSFKKKIFIDYIKIDFLFYLYLLLYIKVLRI